MEGRGDSEEDLLGELIMQMSSWWGSILSIKTATLFPENVAPESNKLPPQLVKTAPCLRTVTHLW